MQRTGRVLKKEVKRVMTLRVAAVYAYKTLNYNLKLFYPVVMSSI